MPRDMIQSIDHAVDEQGNEAGLVEAGVQVTWGHETYVQVASVLMYNRSLIDHCFGGHRSQRENLGKLIRQIVEDGKAIDNGVTGRPALPDEQIGDIFLETLRQQWGSIDGMYISLDRSGINRLIKLLRRARDGAFGRDE